MKTLFFVLIAFIIPDLIAQQTALKFEKDTFTLAFGSCNHQDKPQPLWQAIIDEQPDLWLWLGDNIYGDTKDVQLLRKKYDQVKANKDYQQLRTQVPVIGVWDDHDYGVNDGDRTYASKVGSQQALLDFLDVESGSPVRQRKGVYQSFEYLLKNVTIRLILLDTRYFKDPVKKVDNQWVADSSADLLGTEQWSWLENELQKTADILIVANGTQVIPDDHPFETWGNYPTSRKRLLELLDNKKAEHILLLSGDRHIGELSQLQLHSKKIYELTSSGLTHTYGGSGCEQNKYRVGELTGDLNYGVIKISADKAVSLAICLRKGRRHMEKKI